MSKTVAKDLFELSEIIKKEIREQGNNCNLNFGNRAKDRSSSAH